jgi:uncharacterized membrane protein YozB (DUF420 family)
VPFFYSYCTTSFGKYHSFTFSIITLQFVVGVVAAILALFEPESDHAAILAIVTKVANNLIISKLSIAPDALVCGENLIKERYRNGTLRRNDFNLVDSFLNRLL